MKSFCTNCGKELAVDVKYCPYCGGKILRSWNSTEEENQNDSLEINTEQSSLSSKNQTSVINSNYANQLEIVNREEKIIKLEKNINVLQKIRSACLFSLLFLPLIFWFVRLGSLLIIGVWMVIDRVLAHVISQKKKERDSLKLQNEKDKLNVIANEQEPIQNENKFSAETDIYKTQSAKVFGEKIETSEQKLSRFLSLDLVVNLIIAIPLLILSLIFVFVPFISLLFTDVSLFEIVKDGVIGMVGRNVEELKYYTLWNNIVKECSPTILADLLLLKYGNFNMEVLNNINFYATTLFTGTLLIANMFTGLYFVVKPIINYYKFKNNAQFKSALIYNYENVKPKYARTVISLLFAIAVCVFMFLSPVLTLWNISEYFKDFIDSTYLIVFAVVLVLMIANSLYPVVLLFNPNYKKCYYALYRKVENKEMDEELN